MPEDAVPSPSPLDQIAIKTPCQMDWDLMSGDDQVRFCKRCQKNVYNISTLTESDARNLLHSLEPICARIYRRPDGTVVTNACPSPTPLVSSGRRRFQFSLASLMVLLTASAGLAASAPWIGEKVRPLLDRFTQKIAPAQNLPVMGEMMAPPSGLNQPLTEEMGDVCLIQPGLDPSSNPN